MSDKKERIPAHELILDMLNSWSGFDGSNPHGIGGDHSHHGLGERNALIHMLNNMIIPKNEIDNLVQRLRELIKKMQENNEKNEERNQEIAKSFNFSVTLLEECVDEIESFYKKV